MSNVKNQKMIRLLALRELKTNRRMNLVLIISVILTCVMFTCIASIGGNIILAFQNQTMRMVGGDRMAGLKYVLPADYDKVVADKKTKDVVYRITVGRVISDEFRDFGVELDCAADENAAKACFSLPTTGRLPEKMDEIALSSMILEELGLSIEIGTVVPLMIDIDGEQLEYAFTVCGFWEGDRVAMAQLGWVSREFADTYVPTPAESFSGVNYGGYWQVDFNFASSIGIEEKVNALLDRIYGETERQPETGVNWAYGLSSSTMDSGTVAGLLLIVLVVFLSGYLIIYNIFQINITANIQKYGLLKTIGMTPVQIQGLVRIQADLYALIGIPAGLLVGNLAGRIMYQYIRPALSLTENNRFEGVGPKALVVICLFAAFFSFGTVRLSANKPARIAGKASPMEALHYSETRIPVKKTNKKSRKVSPFSIARSNMERSRKKTMIVVLSLTLSMILFLLLSTALCSMDMDKMLRALLVGDFSVQSYQPLGGRVNSSITPQDLAMIQGMDGVEECTAVYYTDAKLCLNGNAMDKAKKLYDKCADEAKWKPIVDSGEFDYSRGLDQYLTLRNLVYGTPYLEKGMVGSDLYCVSPGLLKYCELEKGTFDEEKFATGKYAIVCTELISLESDDGLDDFYDVGDPLMVRVGDREKVYEVMAVGDIPYAMSSKVYHSIYGHVILPECERGFFTEERNAINLMIKVQDEKYESVKKALQTLTSNRSKGLVLKSKQDYLDEYRDMQQIFTVVGGALTVILAVIAIMNFINAVVTGVISRRKEFIVMQAVGMTGKQMKEMLIWEGATYAIWTILGSSVAGLPFTYIILKNLETESAYFTYHFTAAPLLICMPILLLLAIVVPLVSFQWVSRGDTVNVNGLE